MPQTYLSLDDALTRATERAGATAVDEDFLTELLTLSTGLDPNGVTHYRPFYVAALYLEQSADKQEIAEADRAKFTGMAKPIESLLRLQAAYDVANSLTLPPGFELGGGAKRAVPFPTVSVVTTAVIN